MIRFKCNGEPYIDPLHKFTIEDWSKVEPAKTNHSDMINKAINPVPLTFESLKTAIGKLNEKAALPEGHLFAGVIEFKEHPALRGSEMVAISGDKAYYWPDVFNAKEVKVLRMSELQPENELLKIDYESIDPIKIRIEARLMGF